MSDGLGSHGMALVRWIGLAMVLPALAAVVLLGKDTLMVVERINESTLKRDKMAVDRGFKMLGELHASEVVGLAMRSPVFLKREENQRAGWTGDQVGQASAAPEVEQELIILNPAGQVVFASANNKPLPLDRAAQLLAAAARPMERARALFRSMVGRDFGEHVSGTMTDGLYVNDVITIDGHPAMVTVTPLADQAQQTAGVGPMLLLGVQLLTPQLLNRLATLSHVDGLREISKDDIANSDQHAHPIRDASGHTVTHVTWEPSHPGYAILRAALPAIAFSLGFIAVMTLLAAVTMRRLTRRLAESEQAAIYASHHDAATGLANRGWFMRVFADVLEDDTNATYAVLLIDCDYFKSVNDTLGHAAGDAVLAAVAERLRGLGEKVTITARLGGDEFAVVTAPLADREAAEAQVRDIEAALTSSVTFESYLIMVSVSIGAAVFESPSSLSIDDWLARADTALYRAKREGRGCARFYEAEAELMEFPLLAASSARTRMTSRSNAA
ncbi:GGDEF domain-containing protein [Hyphomicrobium sp. CS1GBMeth3]|uniref:GGDEF domain-containing protein n=1 Tax=Hyphomicrobium sp. CS1GBMeth3 TaxID=1892845 RepID=UPI0009301289|nr:GGDEF domain-containing protein [Hyphomicrobium sp. CS1GBMeth3]